MAVRLRLFLGMWVIIAVVVGLTVLAYDRLDIGGDGGDQIVSGPDGTVDDASGPDGTDPTATTTLEPGPGEVRVRGTVTTVLIADAVLQPREVPTPLTVTSERGFGNGGELTTVLVDGQPASIVWDGGRPFTLSSGGALVLDPVNVALLPEGFQLVLGQGNHAFVPGTYQLDTPVAVGTSGIATPRDSVTFEATDASLFEARGDASLLLGPEAPRRFIGPGKLVLGGTLEIEGPDGTQTQDAFATEVTAFDLTFTPDGAGGWTVDGLVDQPTAATLPSS